MKAYVAAKFERKAETLEAYEKLRKDGHTITADWTKHRAISPYEQNHETALEYTKEDAEGVMDCDVFIALGGSESLSTGVCAELGIAIAMNSMRGKPKIYLVGNLKEKTMFCHHPAVIVKKSIEEVLEEIRNK